MEDLLILVDRNDREVGYETKENVHYNGLMHRAFSVFLYDIRGNQFLLQKRARKKYHSNGLWTNSCCSHPHKGETLSTAIIRRVREELGIDLQLCTVGAIEELGTVQYFSKIGNLYENEIDHVFWINIDRSDVSFTPDPDEIEELRWVSEKEIIAWQNHHPEDFTVWFPKVFLLVLSHNHLQKKCLR